MHTSLVKLTFFFRQKAELEKEVMKSAKLMEIDSPVEETKEGNNIAHFMSKLRMQ